MRKRRAVALGITVFAYLALTFYPITELTRVIVTYAGKYDWSMATRIEVTFMWVSFLLGLALVCWVTNKAVCKEIE